jgi:hypothetical protein
MIFDTASIDSIVQTTVVHAIRRLNQILFLLSPRTAACVGILRHPGQPYPEQRETGYCSHFDSRPRRL